MCCLPYYLIVNSTKGSRPVVSALSDEQMVGTIVSGFWTQTATFAPSATMIIPSATSSSTPSPTETITPVVNAVSSLAGSSFSFAYSYYYPPLLGANCHPDNVIVGSDGSQTCKDVTDSGRPWSQYIGSGLAIPIQYSVEPFNGVDGVSWCQVYKLPCIDYGTVFQVLRPVSMAGNWIVIDTCGDCIKNGLVYVDFLDIQQREEWSVPVEVIVK